LGVEREIVENGGSSNIAIFKVDIVEEIPLLSKGPAPSGGASPLFQKSPIVKGGASKKGRGRGIGENHPF
jgi:hypothetical protein